MEPIKYILLEDHPLYREGLKEYINRNFPTAISIYDGDNFSRQKVLQQRINQPSQYLICILVMGAPLVKLSRTLLL